MDREFYEALVADLDIKIAELVDELARANCLRADVLRMAEKENGDASLRPRSSLDS